MIRLNLGAGQYRLEGNDWQNWDEDPATPADRHVHVPPILLGAQSCSEVYMGHLLEHFEPAEANELLRECLRVLVPGGRLGVVVPDTRAILEAYTGYHRKSAEVPQGRHWQMDDLDDVCGLFLYSTYQSSRHKWSYDAATLHRALGRAGFTVGERIDPYHDPRIAGPAWWNLGYDAFKPEVPPCG